MTQLISTLTGYRRPKSRPARPSPLPTSLSFTKALQLYYNNKNTPIITRCRKKSSFWPYKLLVWASINALRNEWGKKSAFFRADQLVDSTLTNQLAEIFVILSSTVPHMKTRRDIPSYDHICPPLFLPSHASAEWNTCTFCCMALRQKGHLLPRRLAEQVPQVT